MKLYRSAKGTWAGTIAALKEVSEAEGSPVNKSPTPIEVPTNPKDDLIAFLNDLGSPAPAASVSTPDTTEPVGNAVAAAHAAARQDLDTMFSKAPMRQRLRLAVTAIDGADAMLTKAMTALAAKAGE